MKRAQMLAPRVLATTGVVAVVAGMTAAAGLLPSVGTSSARSVAALPVTRAVLSLVCPGPETLLVPDGGRPVDPGGAVLVRALAASSAGPVTGRLRFGGEASAPAAQAAASPPSGVTATTGAGLDFPAPAAPTPEASPPPATPPATTPTPGAASTPAPTSAPGAASASAPAVAPGSVATTPAAPTTASGPAAPGPAAAPGSTPGRVGIGTLALDALGPGVLEVGRAGGGGRAEAGSASSAAVQSTLARSGDLRALTGTRCGAPAADSWLVGGATGGGERMRLLLANPAATPAVVDVDVRGPKGPVAAPAGEGVVVPPGSEIPLYVDALAPGLDHVALHVTAREGRVRATLHDSLMRGLVPGGADDVPVAAPPSRRVVVPGVSVVDAFGKNAGDPDAAGSTSLRVAVPGTEEAVVRVRLLNGSGTVALPRVSVVNVPAGGVADVPVSGIAAGTYAAVIESDVPVVAAAKVGREPTGAAEFGWSAGASTIAGGYSLLQPGTASTLSLAATGKAGRLRITEVRASGKLSTPSVVTVPAGASAAVRFSSSAVGFLIDQVSGGPVQGAVVATVDASSGTMISVLPVDLPAPLPAPTTARHDPRLGLR